MLLDLLHEHSPPQCVVGHVAAHPTVDPLEAHRQTNYPNLGGSLPNQAVWNLHISEHKQDKALDV